MATTTKRPAKKAAAKKSTSRRTTPADHQAGAAGDAAASGPAELRDVPLRLLVKHPKNPRHRAVADAELIESIKAAGILEPVVVAPLDAEKFVIIMGHRRVDGAKKAGLASVPVLIRRDLVTGAQQVEVMLIENLQREGFTPIEEAEGYATLQLDGLTQKAIAARVGRDVKTVRNRLGLLKLSTSTRSKVHKGQLTLDDASAMTEFADDPDATKRLEKAASATWAGQLKQQVSQERRLRDQTRNVAARKAKLLDAGATELQLGEHRHVGAMLGSDLQTLDRTHSVEWGQHKKCLAFVAYDGEYSGPQLHELCTNPTAHRAKLDAEARRREEESERHRREAKERTLAEAAAADRRFATTMRITEGAAVPDAIGDLLRVLLPLQLADLSGEDLGRYQRHAGIVEGDRWTNVGHGASAINQTRWDQHLEELAAGSNVYVTKVFSAWLAATGEDALTGYDYAGVHGQPALHYLALLNEAGHDLVDVDLELRDRHRKKLGLDVDDTAAAS